jgi:GT2 family glycosyltransferase
MGAKEAGHDILAFIDDDIILDENYIKNIESHMNRGVAGICGRILLPDTCLPYAKTQTEKLALINTSPYRLKKCIGGNMAFQRKPFMEIGGFDEMFGVGGKYGGAEDIDIVLRLLQKNYTVIYAPDVVGYHPKENRSDLSAFSRKSYLYGIGEGAVYSKHFFRYKLYSIMMNYLLEIIKPFTRILLRPVLMNCESNIVYLSIIGGRLSGFYKYKTQELQKKLEGKRNYDGGK